MAEWDGLTTFGEVVQWCARSGARVADVVVQDEFTHDLIVTLPDRRALVFDGG